MILNVKHCDEPSGHKSLVHKSLAFFCLLFSADD